MAWLCFVRAEQSDSSQVDKDHLPILGLKSKGKGVGKFGQFRAFAHVANVAEVHLNAHKADGNLKLFSPGERAT